MRVVTYARVSTIGQETEGESLANQERAFKTAAGKHRWSVVRHYREAASAKSIEGRAEFTRMITELPKTKPAMIVVDTLDRFTRNLREGMNLLEELRGHHIGLLPLDWQRREPLDLDDDRDWADVVAEFTAAERERRRIAKRLRTSYQGRRDRGAVTANRTPFGLLRRGDHFVPGPNIGIVQEAENRILAGESWQSVADWARNLGGWQTIQGLRGAMVSEHYVRAGARSVERHRELAAYIESSRTRFAQDRKHEHEFTGVFACGICGRPLYGRLAHKDGKDYPFLVCWNTREEPNERHRVELSVSGVAPAWARYIDRLRHAGTAQLEAALERPGAADTERALQRRLSDIDQRAAALKRRRDSAFDLLNDNEPAVQRQARKLLSEVEQDESALQAQREAVLGELARAPAPQRSNPKELAATLEQFGRVYARKPIAWRNRANLLLVAALGSRPRVYKEGRGKVRVEWPEVEAVTAPAVASPGPRTAAARG